MDRHVKEVLSVQGLPVKKQLVTYSIEARFDGAGADHTEILPFASAYQGLSSVRTGGPTGACYKLGETIVLWDATYTDNTYKGNRLFLKDDPTLFRSGKAHRMVFQIRFEKSTVGPPSPQAKESGREFSAERRNL